MNLTLNNKKFWRIVLVITIISFLWISTFGLLYGMKSGESESSCLFSIQAKECNMNFSKHITLWQGAIIILPQNTFGLMSILALIILLSTTVIFWKNLAFLLSNNIISLFKFYLKQHPQIKLFDYLREIFSSGILNTKKYKLAIV